MNCATASGPVAAGRPWPPAAPVVPPVAVANACTDCAVVESIRPVESGGREGIGGAIAGGLLGAILVVYVHGDRRVRWLLSSEGINVHRSYIGSWLTSQEMAGFSITLTSWSYRFIVDRGW